MGDAQITLRVDSSLKEEASMMVDKGKYHNLTDFIQKAMRAQLERDRIDEKERFRQTLLEFIKTDDEIRDAICKTVPSGRIA